MPADDNVMVQGPDGKQYQFPTGTDKASAIAYFRRKGIGTSGLPAPPKGGFESPAMTYERSQQSPVATTDIFAHKPGEKVSDAPPSIGPAPSRSLSQRLTDVFRNSVAGYGLRSESSPYVGTEAGKEKLLGSPEELATPGTRTYGALQRLGDLATVGNVSTGVGIAAGTALLGPIAPTAATALSRLIAGKFTYDMAEGLYRTSQEYRKAVDAGDMRRAREIQGQAMIDVPLTALSAYGALGRYHAPGTKEPLGKARVERRLNQMTRVVGERGEHAEHIERAVGDLQHSVEAGAKEPTTPREFLDLVNTTERRLNTHYGLALQQVAGEEHVPTAVSDALKRKADELPSVAKGEAQELRDLATEYERPRTVEDLDKERRWRNDRADTFYSMSPEKQMAAGWKTASVDKLIADGLRDLLYDDVLAKRFPGEDFRDLKQRQTSLLELRNQLKQRVPELKTAQRAAEGALMSEQMTTTGYMSGHGVRPLVHAGPKLFPKWRGPEVVASKLTTKAFRGLGKENLGKYGRERLAPPPVSGGSTSSGAATPPSTTPPTPAPTAAPSSPSPAGGRPAPKGSLSPAERFSEQYQWFKRNYGGREPTTEEMQRLTDAAVRYDKEKFEPRARPRDEAQRGLTEQMQEVRKLLRDPALKAEEKAALEKRLGQMKTIAQQEGAKGDTSTGTPLEPPVSKRLTPPPRLSNMQNHGGLPPLESIRDNYRKSLSTYTPRLYHETSVADAAKFLGGTLEDMAHDHIYFSNTPDLALGQGGKRGVLVELDSNDIQGTLNKSKPAWEEAYRQGGAEFIGKLNHQKVYRDAVRSVTIKPDAMSGSRGQNMLMRHLLDNKVQHEGWTRTDNPDGSVTWRMP